MNLSIRQLQGPVDVAQVKQFLLGREPSQPALDYWTAGQSTVGTFQVIFDSPTPHHWFWHDAGGDIHAHIWLHPEPSDTVGANPNSWRLLIHPEFRKTKHLQQLIKVAEDKLPTLLSKQRTHGPMETVAYGNDHIFDAVLADCGYGKQEALEVYMQRNLQESISTPNTPSGYTIRPLEPEKDLRQRAGVQSDAFAGLTEPDEWSIENAKRFVQWYQGRKDLDLVAEATNGEFGAFALFLVDAGTLVGELDPVGTRVAHQQQGLSKALLLTGLQYLKSQKMQRAVVRTDVNNAAAIRAYESVSFEITDHLYRYTKVA